MNVRLTAWGKCKLDRHQQMGRFGSTLADDVGCIDGKFLLDIFYRQTNGHKLGLGATKVGV